MKTLFGILFLVFVVFLNSIGGQQETHSPIRTFAYKSSVHRYLADLMRKVSGQRVHLEEHTILAVRGANVFGWVNIRNTIQPIFYGNSMVIYNLDEHVLSNKTLKELIAYGIYKELPVIDALELDPMRTFHYNPTIHHFYVPLRKQILSKNYEFDSQTILVARGGTLFGWVNEENDVEPIFLRNHVTIYNLYEHVTSEVNLVQLVTFGVFKKLPASLSGGAQPRSRSKTRSPKIRRQHYAESSARSTPSTSFGGNE